MFEKLCEHRDHNVLQAAKPGTHPHGSTRTGSWEHQYFKAAPDTRAGTFETDMKSPSRSFGNRPRKPSRISARTAPTARIERISRHHRQTPVVAAEQPVPYFGLCGFIKIFSHRQQTLPVLFFVLTDLGRQPP